MTPAPSVAATRRAASSETVRSPKAPGETRADVCHADVCHADRLRRHPDGYMKQAPVRRRIASESHRSGRAGPSARAPSARRLPCGRRPVRTRRSPRYPGWSAPRSRRWPAPARFPPPQPSPRWKRSNTASRWSSGIPGPVSSTRVSAPAPGTADAHLDPTPVAGELARVVDEHAGQTVDQVGTRLDGEGATARPLCAVSTTRRVVAGAPNRCTQTAATSATSTTSARSSGVAWLSARASQSKSSTMPRHPRALVAHPFEHVPVGGRITRSIESQLHLGLDDRDRCAAARAMRRP